MEQRILKVIFSKAGGNASKNSYTAKLSIPSKWLEKMQITKEDREVLVSFQDNKIIIKKKPTT